jgi:hypothetical protein
MFFALITVFSTLITKLIEYFQIKGLWSTILGAIGIGLVAVFCKWLLERIEHKQEINNIYKKLNNTSTTILISGRGLLFSLKPEPPELSNLLNEGLIFRYNFPVTLDNYYYLSEDGRAAACKVSQSLYPRVFCDVILLIHFKGEAYQKEFAKKSNRFNNDYGISFEDCEKILDDCLKERGYDSKQYGDIFQAFNAYSVTNNNSFQKIDRDLMVSFKERVKKQRKPISFRRYKDLK